MICVFAGTDGDKRQDAVSLLLGAHPGLPIFRFDDLNKDVGVFLNFVGGSGLFDEKRLVVIDRLLASDFGGAVLEKLPEMGASENVFVIVEEALEKAASKALEQAAEKFQIFDAPKTKDARFNIFQITDAFGARDKKNTWVLMQKALREDISAEEILNILIWQTKNLLLARGAKSAAETGLAPFVYQKSSSYARNFEEKELHDISKDLATLYHESHLGLDLEPNLELFILRTL